MRSLFLCILTCFVVFAGCRKNDFRRIDINVPDMKNNMSAQYIKSVLGKQPGIVIQEYKADITNHTITITYDSMLLALKNIEFIIAKAGFTANDVPADPKARSAFPSYCK